LSENLTIHMTSDKTPATVDSCLWHEGERAMQEAAGIRAALEQRGGAVLRDHMPDQHREFFAQRQQIYLSLLDHAGRPWATLLEGELGFITSPHPRILAIAALPDVDDPARAGISNGAPVGVLGIEFATRRRNRLNGEILYAVGAKGFMVQAAQSFGNCAQYIQSRRLATASAELHQAYPPAAPERSSSLLSAHVELIAKADTFFIASRSPAPGLARSEGLDMSHRGGLPGFVRIESERRLMFPDYRGNFFFNTLGNLQLDPRCGLLFLDFTTGTTLQLIGRGSVLDGPANRSLWPGAERAVAFDIDDVVSTARRSRLRFDFESYAPQLERLARHNIG
jgi:predicted pyridoxine 5'-phosphate oxidase superfamily flavin-nucleotide-binding protein